MTNPTAAMLVIGDEILSGRTRDANMHFLAGELTKHGIDLREVRIVSDDHEMIVEAVTARLSRQIVQAVRVAIADLDGVDRVVTAVVVALDLIRAEPLGHVIMGSVRPGPDKEWLTKSRLVAAIAEEVIGRHDGVAAQWLVRATLALWFFPGQDRDSEADMVRRFVGPVLSAA